MVNVNSVVQSVVGSLSVVDANGNVTDFDYEALKEICTQLTKIKSGMKEQANAKAKELKEANEAVLAEKGKVYYDSLSVGDTFQITNSKGEVMDVRKIETKSSSGSSAACELLNPPAESKTAKRYPKFKFVIIPTEE